MSDYKYQNSDYDVCIIGGGLSGLALSILMARKGYSVALFEQKKYPFHRVCGEYVSLESWPLLSELGVSPTELSLPRIQQLLVSSSDGNVLNAPLEPGGYGVSRYFLDHKLAEIARQSGVSLFEKTRINKVMYESERFVLSDGKQSWNSHLVCGAFGKFSNMDQQLREQELPQQKGYPTFVGVKYHIKLRFPRNLIALHNFPGGYCGLSAVESEQRYNLCYLMRSEVFKAAGANTQSVAEKVLSQNPYLFSIFEQAEFMFDKPLSIAQVYFKPRQQVINHLLLLGDAGGVIPPLCGNGMSMGLHAARILEQLIDDYFEGRLSRKELECQYQKKWRQSFALRLRVGRLLQHTFGKKYPTQWLVGALKPFPEATRNLIGMTHGKTF